MHIKILSKKKNVIACLVYNEDQMILAFINEGFVGKKNCGDEVMKITLPDNHTEENVRKLFHELYNQFPFVEVPPYTVHTFGLVKAPN